MQKGQSDINFLSSTNFVFVLRELKMGAARSTKFRKYGFHLQRTTIKETYIFTKPKKKFKHSNDFAVMNSHILCKFVVNFCCGSNIYNATALL